MGNPSLQLYPGILIDWAEGAAFARTPEGGLAGIGLATGDLLWRTELRYTPLFESQGLLAVLAPSSARPHVFRIAWLDATRGSVSSRSDEVVLPDWVNVGPARGHSFQIRTEHQGSDLLLHWQARAFYAGGARPTQAVLDAARKEAAGRLRIGWGSDEIEVLPSQDSGVSVSLPEGLEDLKSWQYRAAGEWRTTPLIQQDRVVTLELASSAREEQLLAISWDRSSGRRISRNVLTRGKSLWAMASPDELYLFVVSTAPKSQGVWSVFSLADGEQLGTVKSAHRLVAASVDGSIALVLADPEAGEDHLLQAMDLDSGELKWTVNLLGPLRIPPAR